MGFLFGLMIGTMAAGGAANLPSSFGSIPFRCLAAFEISEAEYAVCRRAGLRWEIVQRSACTWNQLDEAGPCSFNKALTWEIAGLRELKKAIEKQSAPR